MSQMPSVPAAFHITDVANIAGIIAAGGLSSDARMPRDRYTNIGYHHIKDRRLTQYLVNSVEGRPFVGQFVPFYYCPRSVMLFTVNCGNAGRPAGCQRSIVHLVCRVSVLGQSGRPWAISDGNAGAAHTSFFSDMSALQNLDWAAINSNYWSGVTHQKQAEFLVLDFVPWEAVEVVGCYDQQSLDQAAAAIAASGNPHRPRLEIRKNWYY